MLALRLFPLAAALLLAIAGNATPPITLTSPDGNIRVTVQPTDSFPVYSIKYKDVPVVEAAPLDLVFKEPGVTTGASFFGPGLLIHAATREGTDNYTLPVGRNSQVNDHYNESAITLEQPRSHRRLTLLVRAYNEGIAFRWVFPKQPGWTQYELLAENTNIRLAGDPYLQASYLPGYTSSHEGRYTRLPFHEVKNETLMDMPVFLEFPTKACKDHYIWPSPKRSSRTTPECTSSNTTAC